MLAFGVTRRRHRLAEPLSHWNDETVQRWVEGFPNAKPKRQKPGRLPIGAGNSDKATAKGHLKTWIDVVTGLMAPTVPKQKKKTVGGRKLPQTGRGVMGLFGVFFSWCKCLFVVGVGFLGVPEPKMMGNTVFAQ